ncbi:MAG: ATP-binding protein, partial [Anaerolineae bacterium]|nr:ATP-binding protein [Anaerolineae bacterium]
LNNALKHAAAGSVTVRIEAEGDRLRLEVSDDGRGFDPDRVWGEGGMGLESMRQRAERLHGTFEISSGPGQGTSVRVTVEDRPRP